MYSANKESAIKCEHCKKMFKTISIRNRHSRNKHGDASTISTKSSRIICPMCSNSPQKQSFFSYDKLMQHVTNVHDIQFETQNLKFETLDEFKIWKRTIEKETKTFYSLNATKNVESGRCKVFYYECHRSNLNNFESNCMVRAPKFGGSIKMNGVCTSRIKAEVNSKTANVTVVYVSTHIGHKLELRDQLLTEDDKSDIIQQIRSGVSYETVLKKAKINKSSVSSGLNLLTRKNIYYFARKSNLRGKVNKSDLEKVEIKVAEWNLNENNVFLFKKIGDKHDILEEDDFALGYMNKEMQYMLTTFGSRIICIDVTHGMNPNNLEFTTVLVLDDQHIGHPVVFLISNRKDTTIQEVVLQKLKDIVGILVPEYIMTGDTPIYYNAWCKIMGPVPRRLLSTWYIMKNWRIQCKSKISNSENRKKILQDLNGLLKETDETEFLQLKSNLMEYLRLNSEYSFLNYLEAHYFKNEERTSSWAHYYRKNAGINSNMHLEALHKNLQQNYFYGNTGRSLEAYIEAIDKFIIDKSTNRNASILKPTAKCRDLLVNKFHKHAMDMSLETVTKQNENTFLVYSQSNVIFYEVKLINDACKCRIFYCKPCNTCIHRFICSCYEASVKNIFCKHMHLVAKYITVINTEKVDQSLQEILETPNSDEIFIDVASTQDIDLIEFVAPCIAEISDSYININNNTKEQCRDILASILNQCRRSGDYDYVLKELLEIRAHISQVDGSEDTTRKRQIENHTFFPNKKNK